MKSPKNVKIGEYYDVPTVINEDGICPIIFPGHYDNGTEICIDQIDYHYHIDKRFIDTEYDVVFLKGGNIVYSKAKCLYSTSNITYAHPFMIEKLHKLYKDHKIKKNICGHQGAQLFNKCGTCPNHGLVWDLKTKKLKYQHPFFLELFDKFLGRDNFGKGQIEDGYCEIVCEKQVAHPHLVLIDSLGRIYPDCDMAGLERIVYPGEKIKVTDGNCFKGMSK